MSWSENTASVQNADRAFSPLDEELELLPGKLTPHAHECLIRFGTIMPFAKAAKELEFVLKVGVSEPTARRYVEAAGKAYEEYQTVEVERLEQTCPPAKKNLQKMFLSVDGAMVPLVGGEWAEVKTLTIGEIQKPVLERGEWVVHSKNHSYFSRMTESSLFRRLALVETHARGIEKAKIVAAVTDGAEWEQGFLDFHCPQAVRILDFPHAAGRVSQIGQAVWGEESEQTKKWLADQLHQLKHDGPSALFSEVMELRNQKPALEVLQKNQAYLEKRSDHMQYPRYQAQHLPIGSGAMENGNKVVVEAHLKGAGMHWAIPHVNPMLTLRNIFCSERWQEGWQQITITLR
ncbi:MAG: ISKra4 family transposase, partial [Thermodesulfovibrionales bacterium]|nr:ISKra4 family transposase [Thermodesulfovibrionales bacterium]